MHIQPSTAEGVHDGGHPEAGDVHHRTQKNLNAEFLERFERPEVIPEAEEHNDEKTQAEEPPLGTEDPAPAEQGAVEKCDKPE